MMGNHVEQTELFSYSVDLDRRVRANNPLRAIKSRIDFSWIRTQVAGHYGYNGHESVDPVIIVKLMFLLFLDDVRSERELMRIVPERLDYLWFLGMGLDDEVPNHSVLSKARARWGKEVFEEMFVRTVRQCVMAGLVDGRKLHMDGSLIDADASKSSVITAGPELIAALKVAYQVQERKLEGNLGDRHYQPLNERMMSTTDPDSPMVRHGKWSASGDSRPRYKQHRAVDDHCGVITAVETTPGDVDEPKKSLELVEQHEANTRLKAETVVADRQYGTNDNYRALQERGLRTHMGNLAAGRGKGIFPLERFAYDPEEDIYHCPSGQKLYPRRRDPHRRATEYVTRKGVCEQCLLRDQCTRARGGRSLMRHDGHDSIARAREQASTAEARRDRWRRRHLMEGSFADATRHHFKRARWRRLWRQQIQDWLIASVQNIKLLLRGDSSGPSAPASCAPIVSFGPLGSPLGAL